MAEVDAKLYEVASPLLRRLRDTGNELGLTDVEIKAEFRDAGSGKEELGIFRRDDYLPYTRPEE